MELCGNAFIIYHYYRFNFRSKEQHKHLNNVLKSSLKLDMLSHTSKFPFISKRLHCTSHVIKRLKALKVSIQVIAVVKVLESVKSPA